MGLSGLGFGAETIATLHKGVPALVGPYSITLDSVGERVGPNYKESLASVTVRSGDAVVAQLEPARRRFASRQMTTTQAGLKTLHFGQVYVAIADPTPDGAVPARLYWKPLVTLIWLGAPPWRSAAACRLPTGAFASARAFGRRPARAHSRNRRSRPMRLIRFAFFCPPRAGFRARPRRAAGRSDEGPRAGSARAPLSGELRCLVCQNELIDDSEAPLARDIRVLIRERIGKGESNDAVRDYLVSRYGDFIQLKPPFKLETWLLWLSPVLTLGLGVAAVCSPGAVRPARPRR